MRQDRAVLCLLAGIASVGAAQAAQHLVNPTAVEVGISRNRIVRVGRDWADSGRVEPGRVTAGGNLVRTDLEVNFHCGDNQEMERVRVWTAHGTAEKIYDRADNPPTKHKRGVSFESIPVAQTANLVGACLAAGGGEATFDAPVILMADCQAASPIPITFSGWDISERTLPIRLDCREVIPLDHAFAVVSVDQWQHQCPGGFVVDGTDRAIAILGDRHERECVRPPAPGSP